ncbi:hypothetical protein CRG98_049685, partial [Punica granatum]
VDWAEWAELAAAGPSERTANWAGLGRTLVDWVRCWWAGPPLLDRIVAGHLGYAHAPIQPGKKEISPVNVEREAERK